MKKTSFLSLGVDQRLAGLLGAFSVRNPTNIQWKALPTLIGTEDHHFIAAQTGMGKTLTYLIPPLQRWIRRGDLPIGGNLVVTCNRELAVQLELVLMPFKEALNFTSAAIYGGQELNTTQTVIQSNPYFLCGTIDKVMSLQAKGDLSLTNIKQVIVDECDTLIESGKSSSISRLLSLSLPHARVTLVSATFPRLLETLLDRYFTPHPHTVIDKPYLRRVIEEKTHLNLEHIKHEFVPVDQKKRDNVLLTLLLDVSRQLHAHESCLIFCNTTESANRIHALLEKHRFPVLLVHSQTPPTERLTAYLRFKQGEKKYLVCTDMAARGLDFPDARYVVQAEFARNASDYLHRAGRTGRCYRPGTVVSLYLPTDERLITQLKTSFDTRTPLNLPSTASSYRSPQSSNAAKPRSISNSKK